MFLVKFLFRPFDDQNKDNAILTVAAEKVFVPRRLFVTALQ
jgi:hypothetical protein